MENACQKKKLPTLIYRQNDFVGIRSGIHCNFFQPYVKYRHNYFFSDSGI
jgi:hypothetical protein